ncbi:MAG: glycosyltransferase family 39 protein [Candidatus Latescibacteria bacterium]|nr:glycosyltransferase family 39 protein [Candidatus Latescibacterota bacterium]
MRRPPPHAWLAALCLLLGAGLRLAGLMRDLSDFVLPVPEAAGMARVFYQFHPDEETLVRAGLKLDDPLSPPLTAYGTAPMYLVRGLLELVSIGRGPLDLDAPRDRPLIFLSARLLSVALSCLSLGLLFALGRRCWDVPVACLALFLAAVAPIGVQQAHFYTIDGLFTCLSLAIFYLALRVAEQEKRWHYLLCGALIGACGAVRFNGLLLGGVLLAAHLQAAPLQTGERRLQWVRRRRGHRDLCLAGLAAAGVLLALEPFLLFSPELLSQVSTTDDLAYSLQVARGQLLSPWSLADLHTLPYLHYWTHLWPLGVGWPLTVVFLCSLGHALWRRRLPGLLALGWVVVGFALIGGLHTKHLRYLLPLFPFCCLLGADLLVWLSRWSPRWQWAGWALSALVAGYTAFYGLAFVRIYLVEDSRIQAARWLAQHAPQGSAIGVEHGGFSLRELIVRPRHRQQLLNEGTLFGTHGYLSCASLQRYLAERLRYADYVVITDVNRYRQYLGAPEFYPAMAEFYRRLVAGQLGFTLVQRFKVYPALLGIAFRDDEAEPSFLGYDHPAVFILEQQQDFAAVWERWAPEADPRCPDQQVRAAASALAAGDLQGALQQLAALRQSHPETRYSALIEAFIHHQQNQDDLERMALKRYVWGYGDLAHAAQFLPWAAAVSLMDADLDGLALQALADGYRRRASLKPVFLQTMADSYIDVAQVFYLQSNQEYARQVYQFSAQIQPRPLACNALGVFAYNARNYPEARAWWEQSLQLDSTQAEVHKNLFRASYLAQDYSRALHHLESALRLDQTLTPQQRAEDQRLIEELRRQLGVLSP